MGKIAFVFPGQGSQTVGMGSKLIEESEIAKATFQKADEALQMSLSDIMLHGPQETLTLTENAQPALLTMSSAVLHVFQQYGIQADYTAGHSLGEYSALVAAGALSFEDAVYAVRKRGELMAQAVPAGQGTMAAVLGMEAEALKEIAENVTNSGKAVQLANLNCPGQIVISGTVEGVNEASELAKEAGAKRVIPLDVSGPFHSELMKPAAEQFHQVLENIQINDCQIPVIANVTATEMTAKEEIKAKLVEQLYSPVRWEQSVNYMLDNGVDTFIEIGSGKVLSGLIKKINRRAKTYAISDMETIKQTVESIKEEN